MNKQEIKELCNTTNPIIFEIGSADGLDTLEFINVFNDSNFKLYCFEPYDVNINEFKRNIDDKRVHLYEGVVGDKNGTVDFNISIGQNIYSSSLKEPGDALFKTWSNLFPDKSSFIKSKVNSITLDAFVEENNIEKIDFIWMDCQGAEDLVIKGGKNSFVNKVKYLYTEYSDSEIYVGEPTLNDILKELPNFSIVFDFKNKTGDLSGGDVLLMNNLFIGE